jgi:hypothetical protein
MFIFIGPPVRHFSDGNQTVCPKLKKEIMPKCRERCLLFNSIYCDHPSLQDNLAKYD